MVVASATPDNHTNTSSHNFTGRMLFMTPNQQCQSTEGKPILIKRNKMTKFTKHTGWHMSKRYKWNISSSRKHLLHWLPLSTMFVLTNIVKSNLITGYANNVHLDLTTQTPDHSNFYRPDALPDTKPTVSKH